MILVNALRQVNVLVVRNVIASILKHNPFFYLISLANVQHNVRTNIKCIRIYRPINFYFKNNFCLGTNIKAV